MIIPGSVYIERLSASSVASNSMIDTASAQIATNLRFRMSRRLADFAFDWNTNFIDNYAQKHVEKWVEMIGLHYQLYSSRAHPAVAGGALPGTPIGAATAATAVRLVKLQRKSMSGDVSGSIAESLLASLLLIRYQLSVADIIHLRGVKQFGRSPDFYLRTITPQLASDVEPRNPQSVQAPVVLEAKGVSRIDYGTIASRLSSAFEQIQQIRTQYGLACVFVRDPGNRQYHALLVVVQP